ncbi:UPF0262 family protein [Altererythrobacter indicus]|uniref:UPF0262 family protein n=1 Tax=Altericroceibacterium indicum TaxID=374177 RepID=A0A845A8U5_9SPHN|nr:UPF0262 family protein [Altericroceibacterium indicum]MXP26124.1 UPF0262 family protein [Altericroceibacterium indicum]
METQCISHVELDETTILWRNADVEQERNIALADLIEENSFTPLRAVENGAQGPWRLRLSIQDGRLSMVISDSQGEAVDTITLGLARLRRPVREYFAICDSYFKAVRRASAQEIETVDMARRATHDQATRLLLEAMEDKIETDFATARRLFTLICVLHIKA